MSEDKAPLVSAERKLGSGTKEFYSAPRLMAWIEKEKEFWDWFLKIRNHFSNQSINNLANQYRQTLSELESTVNLIIQDPDRPHESQRAGHLNGVFSKYLQTCFDSGTPQGRFISGLADIDPVVASWALAFFHDIPMPSGDARAFEGFLRASLFKLGIKERAQGERRALKQVLAGMEDDRNYYHSEHIDLLALSERKTDNAEKVLGMLQENQNDLFAKARKRIVELEETYDKKLALRKPVQYWRRKGVVHYLIAGFAIVILIAAASMLANWLLGFAEEFVGEASYVDEPWRYLTMFLIAGLGIWGLRVGVKILISQLHLASDSRQRATLVLTYLSLLQEGEGLDEGGKELILNALFAPGQSGLLQETSGPNTILDRIGRLISGGSR